METLVHRWCEHRRTGHRGRAFAARHPALVAEQAVQLAPVATRLTVQPNAVLASRRLLDLSKPLEAAGCPRLP